jgi:hypothetical protein
MTNDDRPMCRNDAAKSERVKDAHQCTVIALALLSKTISPEMLTVAMTGL